MRYKVEQDLRDENNKLLAAMVRDIKRHENITADVEFSKNIIDTVWKVIRADAEYIALMDVAASSLMTACIICQPRK